MSGITKTKTAVSVAVPSEEFELAARIIERDLTQEPRFISAPLVLEALRTNPAEVHVRLCALEKFGCTWVLEPMPDAEWLVVIDPEVWASAKSLAEAS